MAAREREFTNRRFASVAGLADQPELKAKLSPGWIEYVKPDRQRPKRQSFVAGDPAGRTARERRQRLQPTDPEPQQLASAYLKLGPGKR